MARTGSINFERGAIRLVQSKSSISNYMLHYCRSADLCADVKCRYGARCDNGRCICQHECPAATAQSGDVTTMAVCGSDGVTYSSECALRRASCTRGVDIELVHSGMCEDFVTGSGSGGETFSNGCFYCIVFYFFYQTLLERFRV